MATKKKPSEEKGMQRCKFCGKMVPSREMFRHWNAEHPDEAREMRRRGGLSRAHGRVPAGDNAGNDGGENAGGNAGTKQAPAEHQDTPRIKVGKSTTSLVEAAMLEFVGQSIQVPNTPALIYGYFCAKKMGFEGGVSEFIQEVIDDFYEARGINYYREVMQWKQPGKIITQEETPTGEAVAAVPAQT